MYHKGRCQRACALLIHEEDFVSYRKIIETFCRKWYKVFGEQYTSAGRVEGMIVGEPIVLTTSRGTEITLAKQADGRLQIRKSDQTDRYSIIEPDFVWRVL